MKFHEAADLFPLLEGEQFEAFVEDIRTEGQLETIKLLNGVVLDGRNRWRACERLGIKPRTEELPPNTHPIRRVVSLNDKRRHLTDEQRALIGAKISNMGRGGDGSNQYQKAKVPTGTFAHEPVSITEAADMMNVPRRSVQRARKAMTGEPEVVQAVEEGRMTLGAAESVVDLSPEKQREAAKQATGKKQSSEKKEERNGNNGETKKEGVGIIRAHEAINCLNRIPKNDPSLKDAFKVVTDWIRHRRKELDRGK